MAFCCSCLHIRGEIVPAEKCHWERVAWVRHGKLFLAVLQDVHAQFLVEVAVRVHTYQSL